MNSNSVYDDYNDENNQNTNKTDITSVLSKISSDVSSNMTCDSKYIYSIFHTLMVFIALYLTFRCKDFGSLANNPIAHLGEILSALTCPYLYIMYILINYGTCDK